MSILSIDQSHGSSILAESKRSSERLKEVRQLQLRFAQRNLSARAVKLTPQASLSSKSDLLEPQYIVNGTGTSGFRSVGMVGSTRGFFCSGTLINPRYVLTAGHCAKGVRDGQGRFRVNGRTYSTSRVIIHPRYNDNTLANDIALYELNTAVTGVTPSAIFRGTPRVGQTLTLVGFGAGGNGTSGHNSDFGTKRVGTTRIDGVNSTQITWRFDNNSESNTAPGDSGGPAFLKVNGRFQLAGVTSGGTKKDASIGDNSFDTRVDAYQSWIDSIISSAPPPPPVVTDDHSDRLNKTATNLSLNRQNAGKATGRLEEAGDRDVFAVTFSQAGQTTFSATATSNLDTYLRVYSATGNLIASNDDFRGSLNSSTTLNVRATRYYVSVGAYQDNGIGDYVVNVSQQGPVDRIGNTFDDAKTIRFGNGNSVRTLSAIEDGSDVDAFKIMVNADGRLGLSARRKTGNLDTILKVYDKNLRRIGANNNNPGTKNARINLAVSKGDTLFVQLSSVGNSIGDYVFDTVQKPKSRSVANSGASGLHNTKLFASDPVSGFANLATG